MKINKQRISFEDTHFFSNVVADYIKEDVFLNDFVTAFPSKEAIEKQIKIKQSQTIDRLALQEVLYEQYSGLSVSAIVNTHIQLLSLTNTFTICTAHQPNIFTGYWYVIYKIIHAIKLAKECTLHFPDFHFLPVYYIGSEDNDLDEIGTIHINGEKLKWETMQTGACGRMTTNDLLPIRDKIIATLNVDIEDEALMIGYLQQAYNGTNSLTKATRLFLHLLFQHEGLIVLDADHSVLKKQFKSIITQEIFNQTSYSIVQQSAASFEKKYKHQATPREINLFYLKDDLRERIVYESNVWKVLNTEIIFDEASMKNEIMKHPDRFSPNVILRPLYQEMILPNVAFVGGGGELAYWLPLRSLFLENKIPFPIVFLRNSIQWIDEKSNQKIKKLKLSLTDLFNPIEYLSAQRANGNLVMLKLQEHQFEINQLFKQVEILSKEVSFNLPKSIEAHHAKQKKIEQRIEQKFRSHLKRNDADWITQCTNLKDSLFPYHALQERYDNFFGLFKQFGFKLFDILLEHEEGFEKSFIILQIEHLKFNSSP
jgi:bacillithiol synthase